MRVNSGKTINRRTFVAGAAYSMPVAAITLPAAMAAIVPAVSDSKIFEMAAEFVRLDNLLDQAIKVFNVAEGRLFAHRAPLPEKPTFVKGEITKAIRAAHENRLSEWHVERDRLNKTFGVDAADDAVGALHDEISTLLERPNETPATSLNALKAKAMVADRMEEDIDVRNSIVRDLLNIAKAKDDRVLL